MGVDFFLYYHRTTYGTRTANFHLLFIVFVGQVVRFSFDCLRSKDGFGFRNLQGREKLYISLGVSQTYVVKIALSLAARAQMCHSPH